MADRGQDGRRETRPTFLFPYVIVKDVLTYNDIFMSLFIVSPTATN